MAAASEADAEALCPGTQGVHAMFVIIGRHAAAPALLRHAYAVRTPLRTEAPILEVARYMDGLRKFLIY